MAIRLNKRRSTFNSYESFSDLVFCTLVLFLVLVVGLAIMLSRRAKQVAVDAAEVEQRQVELVRIESEIGRQQRTLDQQTRRMADRQDALDALENAIAQQQQRVDEMLGTNRFTEAPDPPQLVVAYEWPSEDQLLVHPVAAEIIAASRAPAGLDPAGEQAYFTELRTRFLEQAQAVPGLTPDQYRAVRRAIVPGLDRNNQPLWMRESFRTDLSMVVTGAMNADYSIAWRDRDRTESLLNRLRAGSAYRQLWSGQETPTRDAKPGRATLLLGVQEDEQGGQEVVVEDQTLSAAQMRRVLEALGGGIAVQYQPLEGQPKAPPAWFVEQVLTPTGFVYPAPALPKLTGSPPVDDGTQTQPSDD